MKKYFEGIETLEQLKKEYKKLAMENHPDKGGNVEIMQEINNQYEKTFRLLQNPDINAKVELPEEFINIINAIINFIGIEIEICGTWIWIGGNTKPYAPNFKELGFKWRNQKQKWSFGELTGKSRGWDMDKIRSIHGSEKIKTKAYALS